MPRFGTVKRQYPRVEVLRGYNPNEPFQLSQAYPVADDVTILSGQVMSLSYNPDSDGLTKWILGWNSTGIPYIAINDWNPTTQKDEDVFEAGKLPGLSSAGQFEIQTPFWSDGSGGLQTGGGAAFVENAALQPDGVTGYLKVGTTAGTPIVGYVTRQRGPLSLGNKVISGITYANSGVNSSAVVANSLVVTFQTAYDANPA